MIRFSLAQPLYVTVTESPAYQQAVDKHREIMYDVMAVVRARKAAKREKEWNLRQKYQHLQEQWERKQKAKAERMVRPLHAAYDHQSLFILC